MSMSVTTRAPTWKYLSDPDCALLLVRLVREMARLAASSGIEVTEQDSLVPIKSILRDDDAHAVRSIVKSGLEFKRAAPEHRMSTLQDLDARKPLEIEETIGDAVRRAEKLGLTLPLLETLYRLVAAIDRTNR
jgi:2-dehydropantoate 2-reductase